MNWSEEFVSPKMSYPEALKECHQVCERTRSTAEKGRRGGGASRGGGGGGVGRVDTRVDRGEGGEEENRGEVTRKGAGEISQPQLAGERVFGQDREASEGKDEQLAGLQPRRDQEL